MTVTTTLNYKEYQANAIATTFTIPFLLLNASDIKVYLDSVLVPPSAYTINGIGKPQSEIIFYSAPKGKLLLQRSIELLRETDYQENGDLLADTVNKDFDRLYLILQGVSQNSNQSVKVLDPTGIDPLPAADQRANKILSFDELGQPKLITAESGSATELAQSLLNDTDSSKGAGQVAYNASLDYPTNTVGGQLSELKDNLIPMFTTMWLPSRDSIPAGFVAADGQELPILTYLDAANAIASGIVPTVSENDWINDPTKRGCYVTTSRNGFFRMPDYNGSYADSLGALFLRGGNGTLSNGTIQKDGVGYAQVPITHSNANQNLNGLYVDNKTRLMPGIDISTKAGYNNHDAWNTTYTETKSKINFGATDTRPLNVTGCFIVRLFGAVTEIGKADAKQLITDYADIASRLSILDGRSHTKRFTFAYPNGGTKDTPANVTANSRYIMDNPFLNEPVFCQAEIYSNGMWGKTGIASNWLVDCDHCILNIDSTLQVNAMDFETIAQRLLTLNIVDTTRAANTTALYAQQWMHGHVFDLSVRQVQTHRARLRKIGIDIGQPFDITRHGAISPIIVTRNEPIRINKSLTPPSWYKMPNHLHAVA